MKRTTKAECSYDPTWSADDIASLQKLREAARGGPPVFESDEDAQRHLSRLEEVSQNLRARFAALTLEAPSLEIRAARWLFAQISEYTALIGIGRYALGHREQDWAWRWLGEHVVRTAEYAHYQRLQTRRYQRTSRYRQRKAEYRSRPEVRAHKAGYDAEYQALPERIAGRRSPDALARKRAYDAARYAAQKSAIQGEP